MSAFVFGVVALTAESVPEAGTSVVFPAMVLEVMPRELVGRAFAVLMPGLTLTSMISMTLAAYLKSSVVQGFHAQLLGVRLGPMDTNFSISGVLTMLAGIFAMIAFRRRR